MALRSPKELTFGSAPEGEHTTHSAEVYWDPDADFGGYLKRAREQRGWTTREAARRFGVSQAYITKLEHQTRKRAPGDDLIQRVAEVYGLDPREVMHEAGLRFVIPPSLTLKLPVEQAFMRLLMDPRFRPVGFEPEHHGYYSLVVKQQLLDVALSVARAVKEEGFDLERWLAEGEAP
ncbi:MAG: helix-turn-helix transcriptional regulator [Deltaproteobacteria bacterium]|jgi:transcriptional regulator with XRE-family HTH domain|nr:helix-turn-helix transcriptional regulator [Deltaproteobacteria bacterium]